MNIFTREVQPCVYVRVLCPVCGPVRTAQSVAPRDPATPCPYCNTSSPWEKAGVGETRRLLPYFGPESQIHAEYNRLVVSPSERQLRAGLIVIYCDEPDLFHLAAVHEIWTSQEWTGGGQLPGVAFLIDSEITPPVKHISVDGAVPWWCFPHELKLQQPETALTAAAKGIATAIKRVTKRGKTQASRQ